jgi:predicted aconitase with swiveling domain
VRLLAARCLAEGEAAGPALALAEPLSLWGGLDPSSGVVIDEHHPQRGAVVTGRILVMRSGRGSSSSSSVLAEAVRVGTAPAAIVLHEADAIVAIGAIVARELYGSTLPVVALEEPEAYAAASAAERLAVRAAMGTATVVIDGAAGG